MCVQEFSPVIIEFILNVVLLALIIQVLHIKQIILIEGGVERSSPRCILPHRLLFPHRVVVLALACRNNERRVFCHWKFNLARIVLAVLVRFRESCIDINGF